MKKLLLNLIISVIIVTNVCAADNPPTLDGHDTSPTYYNGGSPVLLFPAFTISDPDGDNIEGLKIYFSSGHHNDQDNLWFSNQNGISGSFNKTTGMLTLTGSTSAANYQTAVRSITYSNNSSTPNEDQRVMGISVNTSAYNPDNGHYYEYVSTSLTWTSAKTAAAGRNLYGMQGYLATVTSLTENNFIREKLSADGWLGGTDKDAADVWRWDTGPEAGTQFWQGLDNGYAVGGNFAYWNSGEPNNSGGAEYYLQIYSSGATGRWNDLGSSNTLGYVVEYGGTSGDPVVNLYTSTTLNVVATTTPTVSTSSASGIGYTYANLGGNVTSDGGATVTQRGIVYSSSNSSPTIGGMNVTTDANGSGTGSFAETIGSLSSSTTYYFRAYAINSMGTSYGSVLSFTTYTPPVLTTGDATIIASSSASVSGSLTTVGSPTPTAYGLVWSTSPNPTPVLSTKTNEGAATGADSFSEYLEGLNPGTRYYYRSYATNSFGTTYGTEKSFYTTPMTCYNITASDFVLNNDASLSGDIATLTPDDFNKNGSVWGKMRIDLDYDFKVTSSLYLGSDDGGADGIAFVLQPLSSNAGSSGGGLGYHGISPSYAVEFDTWYNSGADPTSSDHIAIVKNGEGSISAHSPYSARSNLEDGNWHNAIFEWNATTKYFKVTYEGSVLFNVNIDLVNSIFGGSNYVYWGFTAATGGAKNLQRVDISEYCCSKASGTPPTISAINNLTICPNTSTSAIGFTIGDNESTWSQMNVSASSSNLTLVPNANLVLSGSDANRTITATPATDQHGSTTITVTVTDADGQTADETFVLTVEDVTNPVLTVKNETVYLDNAGTASITKEELVTSASDNCDVQDTSINISTFDCDDVDTQVPVTVTLNDVNGNSTQQVSYILVLDTITPVVTAAHDIQLGTSYDGTGNCSTDYAVPDAYYDDNCTPTLTWEMTGAENDSGTGQVGTYNFYKGVTTIVYTVTDQSSNWSTDTMVVTVVDDENPIITPASDIHTSTLHDSRGNCSTTYKVPALVFTDNCPNAVLTWEMTGVTVDSGAGQISTYYPAFNKGVTTIDYTVTDEAGNISTDQITVTVVDDEEPANQGICGDILTVYLDNTGHVEVDTVAAVIAEVKDKVEDNCCPDDILDISFYAPVYNCSNILPQGYTHSVTLAVTDTSNNTLNCVVHIELLDSTKPVVFTQDITVGLDASGNASIAENDIDDGIWDNCSVGSKWLSKYDFDCNDVGNNVVTLYAEDVNGNPNSATAIVTVEDNILPTAITQDITVWLDDNGGAKINTSQIDDGSNDNCGIDTMWLSQDTFTCNEIGNNTIQLSVKDVNGNIDSETAIVTVIDSTPPVARAKDLTIRLDTAGFVWFNTDDLDDGSSDNCWIVDMWQSKNYASCSDLGSQTIWLYVNDLSGNIDSVAATLTVLDTTPPVVEAYDDTVYLDAQGNAQLDFGNIYKSSEDECGYRSWLSRYSIGCDDLGETFAWVISEDYAHNIDSARSTITVLDTIAPTVKAGSVNVYLDANGTTSISSGMIDDGSYDNCSIDSMWLDKGSFTCNDAGQNTVQLFVRDIAGNISSGNAAVYVHDTIAPAMVCDNSVILYVDGSGVVAIDSNAIDGGSYDNCGIVEFSIDIVSFDCSDIGGAHLVTMEAKDASGNTSTCTANVSIKDNIAPVARCIPSIELKLDSTGIAMLDVLADVDNGSTDNCGIVSWGLSQDTFDCSIINRPVTVMMTVTDGSGLDSTCTTQVVIRDSIAPSVECVGSLTLYLDNSAQASLTAGGVLVSAWDNNSCSPMADTVLATSIFSCADAGKTLADTLRLTDSNGLSAQCVFNVSVIDTLVPVVNCKGYIAELDSNGIATVTAADVVLSTSSNCGIADTSISQSIFDCTDIGQPVFIDVVVSDFKDSTGTCQAEITVVDNIVPGIVCQNITVGLDSLGQVSIDPLDILSTAWDNTTDTSCVTLLSLDTSTFDCSDLGANNVVLTVADASNNIATCTAQVTVEDNRAPDLICNPATVYLWESGEYILNMSKIPELTLGTADNCTPLEDLNFSFKTASYECVDINRDSVFIEISATDQNGNIATCVSQIEVKDSIPPVAVCRDTAIILDAEGKASIIPGMINLGNDRASTPEWARTYNGLEGGSYDACGISQMVLSKSDFTCADVGVNVVELSVIDPSGNVSVCTANLTVVDDLAPGFTSVGDVQVFTGSCSTSINYPEITANDICLDTIKQLGGLGENGAFPIGVTTETWVAYDSYGNTDTLSFDVVVTAINNTPAIDPIEGIKINQDAGVVDVPISGIGYGADCNAQEVVSVTAVADDAALISGISVDYAQGAQEGMLHLTIPSDASGIANVTVTVMDNGGAANGGIDIVTTSFVVAIGEVNVPPVCVAPIPDYELEVGGSLVIPVSADLGVIFDDLDGDLLLIDAKLAGNGDLPSWIVYENNQLLVNPTATDAGCVTVIITATDPDGMVATDEFEVCANSVATGIDGFAAAIEMKMYPNPTRGIVFLEVSGNIDNQVEVAVMDIAGREVYRENHFDFGKIQLDLSNQLSGLYFVKMKVDGENIIKKLVVKK